MLSLSQKQVEAKVLADIRQGINPWKSDDYPGVNTLSIQEAIRNLIDDGEIVYHTNAGFKTSKKESIDNYGRGLLLVIKANYDPYKCGLDRNIVTGYLDRLHDCGYIKNYYQTTNNLNLNLTDFAKRLLARYS